MTGLTEEQINFYNNNGYLAPLNFLPEQEVHRLHEELQKLEIKYGSVFTGLGRNNIHQVVPFIDDLVHHPILLNIVKSLIGPNFLVAGTTLFIKEPEQQGFISWHQDAKYNGFKPYNWVTAWLALTNVDKENGCMYMWPGSHLDGEREHEDTYGENNLLTRGQTVRNVPDKDTVAIELKAGQLSVHHPWVVHGSGQNTSKHRRVGLAIQSYIGTEVKQVQGTTFVQTGLGTDDFRNHPYVKRSTGLMIKEQVKAWHDANKALQGVLYHGAKKIGKF